MKLIKLSLLIFIALFSQIGTAAEYRNIIFIQQEKLGHLEYVSFVEREGGEECVQKQQVIKPNETIDFIWDGKSPPCEDSPKGRYLAQLVDKCEAKGCSGTY